MLFNLILENAPEGGQQSNPILTYVMLGLFAVAIVGLLIWQNRSNKKRQKEAENMVNSLKIGDRVKTIGGICGFVAEINNAENTFVLETGLDGNKSYVKFDKGAIYQTAPADGGIVAPVKEEKVEAKTEEQPKQ